MFSLIKIFLVITTTLVVLLTNLSCHRTPIEPEKTKVNLIYEDALCTEAFFRLKTTEINYPARVDLYLNKNRVNSFTTFSEDTVFVIENLLPKKSYTSYVRVYPEGGREIVSSEVSFVTMDTTSHNFTWQVFEFGNCDNSVLFDVAIIDENNIWAVGEIYMRDSLGRCDPNAYNAVHWDGSKWDLMRIYTYSSCSSVDYAPLRSIYAFSKNNIVVTSGGGMWWFDGSRWKAECSVNPLLTGAINKLWGTSSNDLYVVGDKGNIAHWDGRRWKKIESGTNIRQLDIWGTSDGAEIWTCGWVASTGENIVLRKRNSQWQVVPLPPYISDNELLGTLWMGGNSEVIITGSGDVFRQSILNLNLIRRDIVNLGAYAYRIRGAFRNDVTIVGDFSMVWHWNGVSWYKHNELMNINDRLYGLAVSPTMIVAVGTRHGNGIDRKGLVVIGRR